MKAPTPAQAERLHKIIEECAEVIQIAAKTLDHGFDSYNPDDPSVDNRRLLEQELGDLKCVIGLGVLCGDISQDRIALGAVVKSRKVGRYTHHQRPEVLEQLQEICAADM